MKREERIQRIWDKAKPIEGKNPNTHRVDNYGNEIYKHSYGKTSAKGWEIDHLKPVSKGGSDSPQNLRATHWLANRKKSNKHPVPKGLDLTV